GCKNQPLPAVFVAQAGFIAATRMSQRASSDTQFVAGPQQLAALLNAIEELLLVVSPEGTVLYASSGFANLLDCGADQLSGRSISQLFHDADRQVLSRLLRECTYGSKARGRCRLLTKDGDFRWVDAVARDRAVDPAIQGVLLILSDAT